MGRIVFSVSESYYGAIDNYVIESVGNLPEPTALSIQPIAGNFCLVVRCTTSRMT